MLWRDLIIVGVNYAFSKKLNPQIYPKIGSDLSFSNKSAKVRILSACIAINALSIAWIEYRFQPREVWILLNSDVKPLKFNLGQITSSFDFWRNFKISSNENKDSVEYT